MRIDEEYSKMILASINMTAPLKPMPKDFQKALAEAQPVNKILLTGQADSQDVYLSFFAQVQNNYPELILTDPDHIDRIDRQIIHDLHDKRYPYECIIQCLASSPAIPNSTESTMRMAMAAKKVTEYLNPILSLPQVDRAETLQQCLSRKTHSQSDLYNSALKTVLDRKPTISITEADILTAKVLLHNDQHEEYVKECLEYSPEIQNQRTHADACEEMADKVKAYQDVTTYKDEILLKARTAELPVDANNIDNLSAHPIEASKRSDEEVYQQMRQELFQLRDSEKMQNVMQYWKDVMNVIQESIIQSQKAQTMLKVISTWSKGINQAADDFDLQKSPELIKIQKQVDEVLKAITTKQAEDEKEWRSIYRMIEQMENLSNLMFSKTLQAIQKNPLLKEPIVHQAKPWETVLATDKKLPSDLYAAALRKTVLENPGIGIYEADMKIMEILEKNKISEEKRQKTMRNSLRYRGLDDSGKKAEVKRWVKYCFMNLPDEQNKEQPTMR